MNIKVITYHIKTMQSETHEIIAKFLYESFKPVRLIFPINQSIDYKNDIFSCHNYNNNMSFNNRIIMTPAKYMANILDNNNLYGDFILEQKDDMYTLDTMGKIPVRYVYMLKDFYLKEHGTIDYESKIQSEDSKKYWSDIVEKCPLDILKNIALGGFYAAERQTYKIKVFQGPPYTEDRTWFTKDHNHSTSAKTFCERSKILYSLGNIDQDSKYKYQYFQLGAAEGGINMRYANQLPWQPVRSHVRYGPFQYRGYANSCGYLDVRGHNTYDQRKDLSVEEVVVLYEFLKTEGADVRIMIINGIQGAEYVKDVTDSYGG